MESSDKRIVVVNDEIHDWDEISINGVRYYLFGKFNDDDASEWAVLNWDENGFGLKKIKK